MKLAGLFLALLALPLYAVDSGAVTEGTQAWNGKKIFIEKTPAAVTMTGNLTLTKNSGSVQKLNPNGSPRNVTFDSTFDFSQAGSEFFVINSGSNTLTLKNSGGSTIGTVPQNGSARLNFDGSAWSVATFIAPGSSPYLTSDGTVTGATSQAQVFTNGITLSPTTNQMTLGAAGHVLVISSTAPAGATQTVTLPDPGGAENLVYDGTFANAASTFAALTLPNTTNQVTMGAASHTTIISATAPAAASQTCTIPDLAGSGNFVFDGGFANSAGTKFKGGAGTGSVSPAGVINAQFTSTPNGNDQTEDTLYTFSLPANTLNANGRVLKIHAWGTYAATGDNKQVKLYFGSEVIASGVVTTNNGVWDLWTEVIRSGSSTQSVQQGGTTQTTVLQPVFTAASETDSAGITIKVTGQNTSNNAAAVTAKGMTILLGN